MNNVFWSSSESEVWYCSNNIYKKPITTRNSDTSHPLISITEIWACAIWELGGEWLLFQAFTSIAPTGFLHTSFRIFNHEVKEPRQVQRTLAKICFGIFFSGKKKIIIKEKYTESKWIPNSYDSSHRVQRSFPSFSSSNYEPGKPDHD